MPILLQLFIAGVVPALLVFVLPKHPAFFARPFVKGFGLGVYTLLIVILLYEAFEHGGVVQTISYTSLGVIVSLGIGLLVKEFHHHHENTDNHKHIHTKTSTIRLFISDLFHNTVDGIAIIGGGVAGMIGVLGHQSIQQFGQQILLVESGIKPQKALLISLAVSLSVFFPLLISNSFGESIEPILIALSAGIILLKVLQDLLHTKYTKNFIFGFIIGGFIIVILLLLFPHEK